MRSVYFNSVSYATDDEVSADVMCCLNLTSVGVSPLHLWLCYLYNESKKLTLNYGENTAAMEAQIHEY